MSILLPMTFRCLPDAMAFVSALAKWRNYAITSSKGDPIYYYIPIQSITHQSFSKEMTSADLHSDFLAELFGAFALPENLLQNS